MPNAAALTGEVKLHESAYQAHREAIALIQAAREWVTDFGSYPNSTNPRCAEDELNERRAKVDLMEGTYFSGIAHLVMQGQGFDGPIEISRDGEGCFFWRYPNSGYHGGLIFHANYAAGGTERLPVGTWSIHT